MTEKTTRLVGRPRGFDLESTLEKVLELFWKNGYHATSTRELEAKLGLKQSSIYNAFGSKYALLTAALDRYEAYIDRELLHPLEKSCLGLQAIEQFFASLEAWIHEKGRRGCMLVNMMAEDGGITKEITTRTYNYRHRVRCALQKALYQAVQLEEITNESIDIRAQLLLGIVLGLNIAARGGASLEELQGLIEGARYQIKNWESVPK